jgi:hypothetical protein
MNADKHRSDLALLVGVFRVFRDAIKDGFSGR